MGPEGRFGMLIWVLDQRFRQGSNFQHPFGLKLKPKTEERTEHLFMVRQQKPSPLRQHRRSRRRPEPPETAIQTTSAGQRNYQVLIGWTGTPPWLNRRPSKGRPAANGQNSDRWRAPPHHLPTPFTCMCPWPRVPALAGGCASRRGGC